MARPHRHSPGGYVYHVMNRGNDRQRVFHCNNDYLQFLKVMREAHRRLPMRVLAYCLMPNHFHFILWPYGDDDISDWLSWLLTTQVARHHQRYTTSGHLWQGRHKSFPAQDDEHLMTLYRYVERNPVRAGLVLRAEDWRWSSLSALRRSPLPEYLVAGPVTRGTGWIKHVNQPQTDAEVAALRHCIARGCPFGDELWQRMTANEMNLQSTLRQHGRPRSRPPE